VNVGVLVAVELLGELDDVLRKILELGDILLVAKMLVDANRVVRFKPQFFLGYLSIARRKEQVDCLHLIERFKSNLVHLEWLLFDLMARLEA